MTPQQQIAHLVAGTIRDPNHITAGNLSIITYPTGVVRVLGLSERGVVIGSISDGPQVLAAAFLALAGSS